MDTKIQIPKKKSKESGDKMVPGLKDYSKDPVFTKKAKEAGELIKIIGLPPRRNQK